MFDKKKKKTFSSLQQVSETSPSVAATSQRLILSVTGETSPRPAGHQGDWGDVVATSPRRCLTHFSLETMWLSTCWHHRNAFTPGPSQVHDPVKVSPWRRLGESASHFLVSQVARVAAINQSRRRLRQWDRPLTLNWSHSQSLFMILYVRFSVMLIGYLSSLFVVRCRCVDLIWRWSIWSDNRSRTWRNWSWRRSRSSELTRRGSREIMYEAIPPIICY